MGGPSFSYRLRPVDLELTHTFRLARGASDRRHNVILEIESEGLVGYGEAAPIARYGQDRDGAAAAIVSILERIQRLDAVDDEIGRLGLLDQPAASAAVDMALRDLKAKQVGLPWYATRGIDPGVIASTSFTIGIDSPEVVVQKVSEATGFDILKVKMGGDDDAAVLQAVRSVTDRRLRIDANEGWGLQEAQRQIEGLVGLGVELVEQPLPAGEWEAMKVLKRSSPLPIFADESVHRAEDLERLADSFHGINIKLMKCGGMGEAMRMIEAARGYGLSVMLGCMVESSLGIAAAVQLSPLADYVDLDGHRLISNDPFIGLTLEAGRLLPSGDPGLGVGPGPNYVFEESPATDWVGVKV